MAIPPPPQLQSPSIVQQHFISKKVLFTKFLLNSILCDYGPKREWTIFEFLKS